MTKTERQILRQELELAQMQGLATFPMFPSQVLDLLNELEAADETVRESIVQGCDECETKEYDNECLREDLFELRQEVQNAVARLTEAVG